ncbi:MAG: KR domain-containing protein, partial [Kibdelosporangium sp.]
ALPDATIDWLHALPLSVDGPVSQTTTAQASWACLDTSAVLLRAVSASARTVRIWWLSHQAQPVEGTVRRPELGLLAGPCEVGPQESLVDGHWLDLPSRDLTEWASVLPELLTQRAPRRLALRQGYWWEPTAVQVSASGAEMPIVDGGVYLVLGGTGGLGRSIAAWLLTQADCRVILLARRARLPVALAPWAHRIELVSADLSVDELPDFTRVDGIVHAAGTAAGTLLAGRDPVTMRAAMAAKLQGALAVEHLIERHRPDFAVYCSSMAAQFGGIGQFDYAAANGLLDGFARHEMGATPRIALNWDIWSEVGMAVDAPRTDARHQAHLAVGLSIEEGQQLFARALRLRLPQLFISTTSLDRAREFYSATEESRGPTSATAAGQVTGSLRQWLGVERLDPGTSLYDLGADSLMLVDLIGEVKRHFGVDIALAQLSHQVTLADVLALAGGQPADDLVSVEVWQPGDGQDVLCLIHPVGGDIQAYRALVSALDPRLTVCLIADPALRHPDTPLWTLTDRVRHYHAALQARFPRERWRWQLGGWSFGAWVAMGMAAAAEDSGQPAEAVHLIDPPPPGSSFHYDDDQLEALFAAELGGTPRANAYAERLAGCCRANLASMAGHTLPRLARTPSWLWLADQAETGLPAQVSADPTHWRTRLAGPMTWQALDTTHYGIVGMPHVQAIADTINASRTTDRVGVDT